MFCNVMSVKAQLFMFLSPAKKISHFHHLQKGPPTQTTPLLCKGLVKKDESSKRNYYMISPRVIIKAIIVITSV